MAYFVYQYNKGEHNCESNRRIKALVENMHDFVCKLGGSVFDHQRDVSLEQCMMKDIYKTCFINYTSDDIRPDSGPTVLRSLAYTTNVGLYI